MARPLTPAQRQELSVEAYELSLRGLSAREIARRFNVSHKTISSYLRAEAARRREERPDYQQYLLDGHRKVVKRCWDELERDPSPHATAQLLHALNAALNSLELLAGVRPPTRSKTEITHDTRSWERGLERLSEPELLALEMLHKKVHGQIDKDTDVLGLIIRKHQAGELVIRADPLELEEPDEEEEIIDCYPED